MGGAFGLTAKTPIEMFKYMAGCKPKVFVQDNGVHREFCDNCGSFLCEYGEQNKDKFRFVRRLRVEQCNFVDIKQLCDDRHVG